MSLEELISPFPWSEYSKKLVAKVENPRSAGFFTEKDAESRGMKFICGEEGSVADGNLVKLYWMVDPSDGIIADAKFQVFGQSALIGASEAACELTIGKNYDQAHRLTTELIDKHLRDHAQRPAFPKETFPHLNLVLAAIDNTAEKCQGIPLAESYTAPPMTADLSEIVEGGYPGWMEMELSQKLNVIQQVLDQDVRPYIALDGGGVEIKELVDLNLIISYQGACTSCFSSVGATLSYIQQILKNKVHPDLRVTPDL